jgi:dTDP-4-dehydrorhamnose reductase
MGAVLIHVSTDYVYDGTKATPYVEDDPTAPLGAYGRSKLAGEDAVRSAVRRHVILRTAWVHSPFGGNFVKTMLRLAGERPEVRVVDDQIGSPTYAPHLAEAILAIARIAVEEPERRVWGTYHATGTGYVSWCGLAREVMRVSGAQGGPSANVVPITTADYPTPAKRPANSRLECSKLSKTFGVTLPDWQIGVSDCVMRLQSS